MRLRMKKSKPPPRVHRKEVNALIWRLGSPFPERRRAAERELQRLLPKALPLLLKAFHRETLKRDALRAALSTISLPISLFAFVAVVFLVFGLVLGKISLTGESWVSLIVPFGFLHFFHSSRRITSARYMQIAHLLTRIHDPLVLPVLLNVRLLKKDTSGKRLRNEIDRHLTALLPEVSAKTFPASALPNVNVLLKSKEETLVLAALDALKRVGNRSTLPLLDSLIRREEKASHFSPELSTHLFQNSHSLYTRAKECKVALETRLAQEQVSQTLLRSSEVPASTQALLRPAADVPCSESSEQLLRSASGD